ncbi:MAG: DUF4129 domain-containing protein [Thermoplasmata archaeon]|nr:DUF4129 domain-containing protein [Thermoplasmata archaeon]
MESWGQQFSKFTVALLLMLFIFALGNLIFNLENLYLGGEDVPEFIEGSATQSGALATSQSLANAIRWMYFGLLGFMILTLMIGAFSFSKSKDKKKWRNLFFQMVGSLAIIAVILGFCVFYEDIEFALNPVGETYDPLDNTGITSTGNLTAVPDGPNTAKVISTFLIFGLFFALFGMIIISIVKFAKIKSTKLDYSDLDLQTQEVADTIQRTIDALAGGSDTRATVIRCYTDMCKTMAKYGVIEEEHLTPREFESLAKDALPIPDELIHELVEIFEEARYSNHDLAEAVSHRALSALEGVKDKLAEVKIDKPEPGGESDGN